MKNVFTQINWLSKGVDFVIVIVGITIAFQLNTCKDTQRQGAQRDRYLQSFHEESLRNRERLEGAIQGVQENKTRLDTLQKLLLEGRYEDPRIPALTLSMLRSRSFTPIDITMTGITASGQLALIQDITLRQELINVYQSMEGMKKLEELSTGYLRSYVGPMLLEHFSTKEGRFIDPDYVRKPRFENIVLVYGGLLAQQVNGYEQVLGQLKMLSEKLEAAAPGTLNP